MSDPTLQYKTSIATECSRCNKPEPNILILDQVEGCVLVAFGWGFRRLGTDDEYELSQISLACSTLTMATMESRLFMIIRVSKNT